MENNIKYICESCGGELEFVLDTRTDNSRYDGTLVHTVPVCSCMTEMQVTNEEQRDIIKQLNCALDMHTDSLKSINNFIQAIIPLLSESPKIKYRKDINMLLSAILKTSTL